MPSSVNPDCHSYEAFEFPADVNVMGGCSGWGHDLPLDSVALKKRKREVGDQGKENASI